MSSAIAKYVSKRILGETIANNFGKEDPYFETVPATRLDGTPHKTKTKKVRKALPPGVSEHDGKVLTKVKRRAYRLDMCLFSCLGIRFGWSSVLGIIPGIGDVLDAFMAMMVFRTCQQVEGGLPSEVKLKMIFNILIDFGIGIVPLLGDLADAVFRANTRNAVVLENYLRKKGAENLKSHGHHIPTDPTDPDEYDRHMRNEVGPPPRYIAAPPSRSGRELEGSELRSSHQQPITQEAHNRGGWFHGFRSNSKQPDVERGDMTPNGQGRDPRARLTGDTPQRPKPTLQKNRP